MRASPLVVALLSPVVFAACQDSYASNAERDTHMGEVRAALPSSAAPHTPGFVVAPPPAGSEHSASEATPVADAGPAKNASPAKDAPKR